MRIGPAWFLSAALSLLASGAAEPPPVRIDPDTPPNLVIIFTDDLGYGDIGPYGHPTIATPSLDRMAREGLRFTQFYAAASVCTPSRAGLLTGRYPIRTGLVQGMIPGRVLFPGDRTGLPLHEITIAEVLRSRGYATMAVGKWHLGHRPEFLPTAQGFDGYFGLPYSNDMDYVSARDGRPGFWNVPLMRDTMIVERPADQSTLTRRYTEESVAFIREHADRPFFLYLAHTMPHIPLFVSADFEERSARGLYGSVVEEIDWSVGRILQALRDEGIGDRTLVVFTSDNGPWLVQGLDGGSAGPLRAGKGTTWEGGMRVPMIAWWPGSIPAGETTSELATTLDLLPTAASLGGAEPPGAALDGFDLLPLLTGRGPSQRDFFAYYRGDQVYAARLGPWKAHFLTQTAYPDGPVVVHDPPELYHLEHDPGERFDVSSEHPDVVESIRKRLAEHFESVGRARLPRTEAEGLLDRAESSGGALRVQDMTSFGDGWGGGAQLWWVDAEPGDRLSLPLEAPSAGEYELVMFFTRARDYGIVRVLVNDRPAGVLVDGFAEGVSPSGPVSLGRVSLDAGENVLTVELLGKDSRSAGYGDGYLVGIDGFTLRR